MSQFEDGSQEEENDDEIEEHDESNLIDVRFNVKLFKIHR